MKPYLQIYMLPALLICLLLAGCADGSNRNISEVKKRIDVEMGAVEKVTVLSTDGQEISIDLTSFLNDLSAQGKDLQLSTEPLTREDVRYTLVLTRKVEAPLVIEVGEQASQFGDEAYRGSGADKFYRWIRKLSGTALLESSLHSVEITADDLTTSSALQDLEADYVWQSLQSAEYLEAVEPKQYPLFPNYRLNLDIGEKVVDATVLTPTLVSIQLGKDTHFFRIKSEMFSRLTEWLPPHDLISDPFEPLFKAVEVRVQPGSDQSVKASGHNVTQSTIEQALSHECIRMLKTGIPASASPKLPKQERYTINFVGSGVDGTIKMYDRYFSMNGKLYTHDQIDQKILILLESRQKISKISYENHLLR